MDLYCWSWREKVDLLFFDLLNNKIFEVKDKGPSHCG
jgi:hypothetical protein